MTDETADAAPIESSTRPRWRVPTAALVIPLVVFVILGLVADALSPTLVRSMPLLLIALSTRNRYLALVAPSVNPVAFFAVGVGRQLLSDPLWYALGSRYGDRARRWVEANAGATKSGVDIWERWFDRAAYPLIALAPNNIICMLAGSRRLNLAAFFAANIGGTVVRIWLFWRFGDIFSEPIGDFVRWIGRYQWWLTGLSIALVGAQILFSKRRGTILDVPTELMHDDEPTAP